MAEHITIVEVGPRDGLQNEATILSVAERVDLIQRLVDCGFPVVEVGSFVSPQWVPQMAETGVVYQQLVRKPGVCYMALVPNERGMKDAIAVSIQDIAVFTAASETFNQKNIQCSIAESFQRFIPVMILARQQSIRVRGYVSCAITCPYEGAIAPTEVASVAQHLYELGCEEISLGDTIGAGTPTTIAAMLTAVMAVVPVAKLAIHCHDTYGHALDNIEQALKLGVRVVDSAIGGVGGCPYAQTAPGQRAPGNVATEAVVLRLQELGFTTGIDLAKVQETAIFIRQKLGIES
jgi:hydroxymethylglutaryl-CoA lyase